MAVRAPSLIGRRSECEALAGVVAALGSGDSRALVLRGEPGIGKTALLDHLVGEAEGCRVVRAAGVQSEMELAFAGLHQVCAPLLDRLDDLPEPQREALGAAFGLRAGDAADRFLVGLAVLGLFAEAAVERPLVCVVDDAQWLDRASLQALAFVGRRLGSESVAVVFGVRETDAELAGLPELVIEGLASADARMLLGSVVGGPLDERVRERIVADTGGNPLALIELPQGLSPVELAGGFGLPDVPAVSGRIERSFRERLEALPPQTRRLLLVAAVEPTGDPALVFRAAGRLGIAAGVSDSEASLGLVEFGTRVRFRHPLVRSAAYRLASTEDRQAAYRALAEATDPVSDPDRRAWHLAQASSGPDEEVASELEASAGRAEGRGGLAAAAAFLERATALTIDPASRAKRALAAAEAKYRAGAPGDAVELLYVAEAGPLDALDGARAERLQARVAYALNPDDAGPPVMLLRAAQRLEPLDPALARSTYLEALASAIFAKQGESVRAIARVLRDRAASHIRPTGATELLLSGQALLLTEGYPAGTDALRQAMETFCGEDVPGEEGLRGLWFACRTAVSVWDDASWWVLATRRLALARAQGALSVVPEALAMCAEVLLHRGELEASERLLREAEAICEATGSLRADELPSPLLAVIRGNEAQATAYLTELRQGAEARGEDGDAFGDFAESLLSNALGRYEVALAAAQRHCARRPSGLALRELIEAAVRSHSRDVAVEALDQLADRTQRGGTDWGLGVEACSRALVSEGEEAESFYREAIERLARTTCRIDLARAHLLYGEWLRRQRRRQQARDQLRTAYEQFTSIGAGAFGERAARELLATGETARKRVDQTRGDLTPQEVEIARFARDGLSNAEIGARLFISPRTVEYHLHKVYGKLSIGSRLQLQQALRAEQRDAPAPLTH